MKSRYRSLALKRAAIIQIATMIIALANSSRNGRLGVMAAP
jgi:hypothetical protein